MSGSSRGSRSGMWPLSGSYSGARVYRVCCVFGVLNSEAAAILVWCGPCSPLITSK